MRGGKARRRLNVRTLSGRFRVAAAVAAASGFVAGPAAQAGNFYWTGASAGDGTVSPSNPAPWTSLTGGSNWSTSPITFSDPGSAPTAGSNVFFVANGATNFSSTILGADFSLNSLTFTSAASGPIGISGTNTLTIGAGGITALAGSGPATIGANVSIGSTAQTWVDNNATSTETIGGTFTAGDIISTVVNGVTVTYTVQASDTNLSGVAIGIANAINANASLAGLVNASTNGAIVNIAGFQGVPTLSSSVTGTETAKVAVGSAMTLSGNLSGTAALTLAGTGSTQTPSGQFIFSGVNSYSGALTLLNANTSLTLGGNGTLLNAASLNLGGGTVFTLDNTGTNVVNRLAAALPVNSNGGTINLLGSASAASADQIGALNLNTGLTNVNVTPGAGNSATLTIASLNRLAGAGINFSSTGTVALTSPGTLPNGIIAPWATIGNLNNNGNLDFATVSGGNVVAYSGYDTNVADLTTAGTGSSASNIKLTSGAAVLGGSVTVNTLYLSGSAGIQINAAGTNTTTLTLGAGGIIANGGTASYSLGNNQALITNATWIGGPTFSGGITGNVNNENQAGTIAVGAGVPDLVVTVGGTYNPVSGLINGALQLNVKNILDTTTALGTRTAATTANSTTVTLTAGTTAGLYPGATVTGLGGTGISGTTQYVVSIIDATHFTIGNAPTTSGAAATATFVGHTGLTKDGNGLLDIADGNANNKTVAYSYAGPVTVNGGVLLIGADLNLGVAPSTFNPAAIVLNGGELRSTAGLSFAANRGITVGPQGGTISYVGGGTLTLTQKITGAGGLTLDADSYNGALTFNISNTTQDTYQGPTILEVKNGSTMNVQTANPLPTGTALTLSLAPSFQSGANAAGTAVTGFGTLNITAASGGLTIGSLASTLANANITGTTTPATLTIGGTIGNPVTQTATYSGILAGAGLSVVKNGGGNQIFTGASTYAGTTTINGGAIVAENATGSATGTGNVTVAIGGTLGSGLNATTGAHTGIIGGNVTVQSGGTLQPTVVGGAPSSLQISGATGLTLNGGSVLNFELGAVNSGSGLLATPTSDNVFVSAGNLALGAGTDTLNIAALSGFGLGTYPLITAVGVPANFNGTNFIVNGPLQFAYSIVDDTANHSLDLSVITNPNPSLTWLGAPGNGSWDTVATNKPWTFTGGGGTSAYQDGANVTFDNTPGQSATITIPANVAPGSITFNNNALVSYTFNGPGAITGAIGFTNENSGTVTFNNVNTFTGQGSIQAGTVVVGATGALADSSLVVSGGAALTVNGALTAPALTLNNAGTLILGAGGSLPVGTTLINSGSATFNNPSVVLSSLSNGGATNTSIVLNGTALTLNQATVAAPPWASFTGTGTLELNAAVTGDWGTPSLPSGFTGTLKVDVGHIASDPAGAGFGGTSGIVIGGGATPGTGAQLDLTAVTISNFGRPMTLSGSGFGPGLQGAALLLGSTTISNPPGLTITTPQPTIATYATTTVTSAVALNGNATIASNGIGIISGPVSGGSLVAGTTGSPTATNGVPGYPILILSNAAGNTYTGTTTVNNGTLQFAGPQDLYNGNAASWTATNITVNNGATLALNVGGPADFTAAQASTVLGNLSSGTSTGWQPGSAFGVDTGNATAPVTIATPLVNAGIWKAGVGTLNLTATSNNYSGPTSVTNGTLILNGSNTGSGLASVTNTVVGGTSVLSIRNANALGSGTANSGLAPINMDAYGTVLSASILEIGATIGTDTGGNNADFSYQLVNPENNQSPTGVVVGKGQISLGILGNTDDGTGFAAFNPTGAPRTVALYEDPNETYFSPTQHTGVAGQLATIEEKFSFGLGGGDHLTLGSSTANATLILLNPVDLNGGPQRRFVSIRGVGTTPEGEYAGAIINSTAGQTNNISFDGNGGLIFDSANTSYVAATLQVDGGAIFVAAGDPAVAGTPGALGDGNAALQIGTSAAVNPSGGTLIPTVAGANIGFMTDGPNHGLGSTTPTVVTARNIVVGGAGVTYASAVLGGASNDYTAMNGNITLTGNLGSATVVPTTFFARNGGRVDFGGVISGAGGVVVGGNSVVVEGDATTPGIALANNGTIVFNGANTYTGATTVSTGKLYINGGNGSTTANVSPVTVQSTATLGGMGTINGAVSVSAGGNLEAGQAGAGVLTLNGNLAFTGAGAIDFTALQGILNAPGTPELILNGTLTTNGNVVTINILGSINAGSYALIGAASAASVQPSLYTLGTLSGRATGTLAINPGNPNELDLNITSSGGALLWTGAHGTPWDTSTSNWVVQSSATVTTYNDSPGDAVIFDDTADPNTSVAINGANVHPGSVTFNNSSGGSAYTISGTHGIAGATGLTLGANGGKVILLNANTFAGPTVINSGTLQLGNGTAGNDGSIANSSSITDNGALVYQIVGTQTYGGIISGTGSLAVQGPGTLTLTNNQNSYSGGTTITTGTLQLGNGTVNNDGVVAGNVTDNGTLAFNYDGPVTIAGAITGTGKVTKSGVGALTLGSDGNSFSGTLTINQGAVIVTGFGADPSGSSIGGAGTGLITINTSGSLQLNPGTTANVYNLANNVALNGGALNGLGGAIHVATGANQTISVGAAGGAIANLNGTGQDLFLDGQLTGSGPLTVSNLAGGTASVVHVTNNTNTYSGAVTVNGALNSGIQLSIDGNNVLRSATVNLNGSSPTGSTLLFASGVTTPALGALAGTGNVGIGGLALTVGGNNASSTYAGVLSGAGSLTKIGTGTLTLGNANSYAGKTNITGGTLKLTASPGLNEGLVSTTYAIATGFPSPVPPVASWTQVTVQPTARWGTSTNNGGANVFPSWGNNSIWGYAGFIDNTTNLPVTYTFGKNFDDGAYVQVDSTVVINDNTFGNTVTSNITLTPGLHAIDVLFAQATGGVGPTGPNYGSFGIAYNTVGNTATTGTWLQVGPASSNTAFFPLGIGQVPSTSAVVMSSNTTFDISGSGAAVTIGSLADAAGGATGHQVLLGSGTLMTGNDNTSTQFSGAISGAGGSLVKLGTGAFTLTGPSTYTGGTTVAGGTLLANNASGSATGTGTVNVGDATNANAFQGVLGGSGIVSAVSVFKGSTIAAGANSKLTPGVTSAVGTLASGAQAWFGGGNYTWKLANASTVPGGSVGMPGTDWDLLSMATITLDGSTATTPFQINLQPLAATANNFNAANGYTWEIAHAADGSFTSLSANVLAQNFVLNSSALNTALGTSPANYSLVTAPDAGGSDLDVVFSPAPEPTSLALLGLAGSGLLLRRKRRDKQHVCQ